MEKTTKITLAWELYLAGIPKLRIAQQLDSNRETVHLWVSAIASNPEGLLFDTRFKPTILLQADGGKGIQRSVSEEGFLLCRSVSDRPTLPEE